MGIMERSKIAFQHVMGNQTNIMFSKLKENDNIHSSE